ncbi:MAG: ABC transporter permease [Parvibaculaceae bacterium]
MTRHANLFLAPAFAVLIGVFALPIALLFAVSFWSVKNFKLQPDFSLAAWQRFVSVYGDLTLYTLLIGLVTGLLCTGLGFVFAYAARFKAGRFGDLLLVATLITLFGGYLVKIYAWKSILGADGLMNQALMALGLTDQPLAFLIYSRGAVIVALVHFLLPFAILPIYAALRNVPEATIEAARDLGATAVQVVTRVVVPQALDGLYAAFAFCFLLAAGDYVTPMLLGGTSGSMLGQFVLLEFSTNFNWPAGSALSFGLLFACLAVLALIAWVSGRILRRPRSAAP